MKRAIGLIALVILSPAPAIAQNHLANHSFDINLADWANPFDYEADWDSFDVDDSTLSGSALLTNVLGNGGSTGILSQCIEINDTDIVDMSARVFQPSGQAGSGVGQVRIQFFSDPICEISISPSYFSTASVDLDTWFTVTGSVLAPPSTAAVMLVLAVEGDIPETTFSTHFDDVVMTTTDSVVFLDDFESGDTGHWSTAKR